MLSEGSASCAFASWGRLRCCPPRDGRRSALPKWRSLLACLLVRPGQLLSTESLIFELWGDNPPSTANNMVSIYVHRLRKEVIGDTEGKMLVHRAPGYLLRVAPGDLDIQLFESLAAEGGPRWPPATGARGRVADRGARAVARAAAGRCPAVTADRRARRPGGRAAGPTRPSCASRRTSLAAGRPR